MSIADPIADMLTRIRNAQLAGHQTVEMPSSKIKLAISKVLCEEGYIVSYQVRSDSGHSVLCIELKYHSGMPVIERLKRVSKPGLRVYSSKNGMPKVLNGLGIAIVSTPKGVMTDRNAKAANVGGEVICVVH